MAEIMIKQALQQGYVHLSGIESARLDAELLLQSVLGCNRSYLYSHSDELISQSMSKHYQALLEQRLAGQPLAYLTGIREFWSLPLRVTPDTLIPRPETETLIEAALAFIPHDEECKVLELGTGSGAIALAIAHERPHASILASDISAAALTVAKSNAEQLGISNIEFILSDWYEKIPMTPYHMIISNPPYIAADDPHLQDPNLKHEPQIALVAEQDGIACLQHIINLAPKYLLPGGYLLLEHGWQQGPEVMSLLDHDFKQCEAYKDLQGLHRASLGRR